MAESQKVRYLCQSRRKGVPFGESPEDWWTCAEMVNGAKALEWLESIPRPPYQREHRVVWKLGDREVVVADGS